jgi:hypothetical protein
MNAIKKRPRTIRIRRYKLIDIVRRVQALEKQGYECINPIQKKYIATKDFKYNDTKNIKGGYMFDGMIETVVYECIMKKVEHNVRS